MKLPKSVGFLVSDAIEGHIFHPSNNCWPFSEPLYTETQLREALAQQEAVMRQALDALWETATPKREAAVWHEGSASYYQAKLIRKISPEEAHGIRGES